MSQVRVVISVVAAIGSVLVVAACSSTTTSTGSSSGSTGSSGTSGTGTSGSSGDSSSFKSCNEDTPSTTCTQAELQPYDDCLLNACEADYEKCYGSNFKSGTFDGPCGTFITCQQKCACGDTMCLTACGEPDMACSACIEDAAGCGNSCTAPACLDQGSSGSSGSSGSGGTHTCADLQPCCDAQTDADTKSACDQVVSSAMDASCSAYYTALKCTN